MVAVFTVPGHRTGLVERHGATLGTRPLQVRLASAADAFRDQPRRRQAAQAVDVAAHVGLVAVARVGCCGRERGPSLRPSEEPLEASHPLERLRPESDVALEDAPQLTSGETERLRSG